MRQQKDKQTHAAALSTSTGLEHSNREEEIASIYRLSQDQRHKACTNTWSIEP
uniref:Uncharacterized protein n=1 Tax=Glycine max TaxID=3847 RepID=C6T7K7_SOYBN|nr:unknown [Glycine max]